VNELRIGIDKRSRMQESQDPAFLREQAARCRRLAASITDEKTAATLRKMAEDFDKQAAAAGAHLDGVPHPSLRPPDSDPGRPPPD
jgi:hypothetical protein